MKPIIGVSSNLEEDDKLTLSSDYLQAIVQAGGIPLVLPNIADQDAIRRIAAQLDGLVLSGGGDIDPSLFAEEPHPQLGRITPQRDNFEIALIKDVLVLQKPILAICRGCQVLNVALKGDMYQDIYAQQTNDLIQHTQRASRSHASHYVHVEQGSLLAQIVGTNRFKVNSFHHQAVRKVPSPLTVSARALDGIIEAIESTEHQFVLGVQWHPESLAVSGDQPSIHIFQTFIQYCQKIAIKK